MNRIRYYLRQYTQQLAMGFRSFMAGRYGTDKLNTAILCSGLFLSLLSTWIRSPRLNLPLVLLSYGLMTWAICRSLSRNTYKRYQENRQFLLLIHAAKDRQNRYFACPKCHQTVRVPRGKGKISITCPRCRESFIKKT